MGAEPRIKVGRAGIMLIPRHEKFIREYIRNGGNASEAYRKVVKTGYARQHYMTPSVIGCNLLKRPDVQARYRELMDNMAKRADITETKILSDYQRAMDRDDAKPADIINAATAQAKLVGLMRDRVEAGSVGDFDNMDNPQAIIDKVRQESGAEAAEALARAFGLDDIPAKPIEEQAEPLEDIKPLSDSVN